MLDRLRIYYSEWNSLRFHPEQRGSCTTRVCTSEKPGETYGNTNVYGGKQMDFVVNGSGLKFD